jgi:hypothetical protein
MNKVPKMISTKDLDYICDAINWNFTNAKKVNHYFEETEDEEVKDALEKTKEILTDHYEFLVNILR